MPAMKRQRANDEAGNNGGEVHPSSKRRMAYSEADARLANIYNDLADDVQTVRLKAAGSLLNNLSAKSPDRFQRVKDALTRLVRGLCSGRKAARLGFSVALSEVLRLAFELASSEDAIDFKLDTVTERIIQITQAESNASGQEKRDHLLGRRFAFQAILQSNTALNKSTTDDHWRKFVDAVADLASERPWIRAECGAMLYEYLDSVEVSSKSREQTQTVLKTLHEKGLLKTPEGVAIWLSASRRFPKIALPKSVWHGNDPLSSEESVRLKKVLHGNLVEEDGHATYGSSTGLRRSQPSFAWKVIFSRLYGKEGRAFCNFWRDAVDNGLFAASSSNERKSLGLQIVSLAITTAPTLQLRHVLSDNVVRCLINQRGEPGRYLFEAARVVLNHVVSRANADPEPQATIELIERLFDVGAINFDQLTKTKTLESVLAQANLETLKAIVPFLQTRILQPKTDDASQVDLCRRTVSNMLLDMVRSHQDAAQLFKEDPKSKDLKLESWLQMLFDALVEDGYCEFDDGAARPPLSVAHCSLFRTRLMSCLTSLLQHPMAEAVAAADMITDRLRSSKARVHQSFKKDTKMTLELADKLRGQARELAKTENATAATAMQAYQLLFALSTIQVYDEEPGSIEVLRDLCSTYQDRDEGTNATTMIVEILLTFLSKPSALFRKLVEQVFSTFVPQLTAESVQSLLDILQQNEGLSGQQELFDHHDDDEQEVGDESGPEDDSGDDAEDIDVEDDSDVEMVNGEVVGDSDDEESEDEGADETGDASSDAAEDGAAEDEDEEAAFDRKLADALGTQKMEIDSDDDGSDMDDDQMMALDGHLITIFKERSKKSNKKQDNKDAKENIVNFKNRVLDLLSIYVKSQHANTLALDLIIPLTTLVRTSTSKPTSEKAFAVLKQYFEACNKNKSIPQPEDHEACFEVLAALHAEIKLGGSKLHANACSRSSLFVAKILVSIDQSHYPRIAGMYVELQSEWYLDTKSKMQGSIFTEWTSWSLATRKQK